MTPTTVSDFLKKIQWPDPESKGIAVWQGRGQGDNLPPTVNLVLTPKGLKAKVFNIIAGHTPQPHLMAEFEFSGSGEVRLVEWKDAGQTLLSGSEQERIDEASRQVSAFITLVGGQPRVDLMGKLFKDTPRQTPQA